jgi:hypothetical protein
MKNENRILAVINGYKLSCGITGLWTSEINKKMKTIVDNYSAHAPQNSCPVQRIQSYLAIQSFASIQACGAAMSNEQQARKMRTSITKTTGGFEYAGEFYAACCAFLSGTDPSMPSKALIQPNELNIGRLLKVTGVSSKMHTGDGLITKAKRDQEFRMTIKKQEAKLAEIMASIDAGAPAMPPIGIRLSGLHGFTLGRQESFNTVQILGSRLAERD